MRRLLFCLLFTICYLASPAQNSVFDLMERRDTTLAAIEQLAEQQFKITGKGKGTGYNQFQRWLYEQQFHVDSNGYLRSPVDEWNAYQNALTAMGISTPNGKASAGIWTESGPPGWNKTSGWNPGTGRLVSMAIHPSNQNTIYVGSPGGGLWKTIDGGVTWTPLFDDYSQWMHIYSLAIDPLNPNILYAGTGNGTNQVIKSTNAGTSWTLTGNGPTGTIRKILIHPTNTSIVFACAGNGIFRSTNAGNSWTQVQPVMKEDIEFKPGNPSIMYASGNSQVVRSTNGGVSWSVLGASEGITGVGRTMIAVTPANPDYVYIVQANGNVFGRCYRSTNSGLNFATMVIGNPGSGTNYFGYDASGTGTTGQANYDMAICASPVNAQEIHIGGIICWKSTNGGASFVPTTEWFLPNSTGYNHADIHELQFVNNTLYSLSDGGIYKSINQGDDWTDLSAGIHIRQFYRIASSPTNPDVITGGAQDNGSACRQPGGNWVDWLGADGMEGLVSPVNHLKIWGSSQNGQLYTSSDGGNSYSNLVSIPGGAWVTPLAIHPTDPNILFAGGNGVFKSVNGGSSFSKISGSTISNSLSDIAVAPSNPNVIYAAYFSLLYVSTNGGTSWNTYSCPGNISDICVSPLNANKLWICTSSGSGKVYVSLNNGASFTNISGILPAIAARSLVVDASADEKLYLGMNIGVYTYSNSNPNWVAMTDNLPLAAINELDLQLASNKLYVATYGRGVWETTLNTAACSAPASLQASGITLSSATLNWAVVPGATSYQLEYKAASAATWLVLGSAITANTYTLSGLSSGTAYDYRVKTQCGISSSYFAQDQFTTLAPTPFCIFSYEPNETQAAASAIGTNTLISAGIGNASDIDFFTFTTTTYTDISISLSNLVQDYDLYVLNASGTVIASGLNGGSNSELVNLLNMAPGAYTIRVLGYSGVYSLTQCYSLQVNTVLSNACAVPGGPVTQSVSGTSALLSWNAISGASQYRVRYRSTGSTMWTPGAAVNTTSMTLNGLQYNTGYEWQVSSLCSPDSSAYSAVSSFTTLPNCSGPIPGTAMNSPIVAGQAPCAANTWSHTIGNSPLNCFQNNYTGANNQASSDIWYQFTLTNAATVQVGHCGSQLSDTYIHLLDSAGNHLYSNDDNGPVCSGFTASVSAFLPAGTYYVVSEGYGSNVGLITTNIRRTDSCFTNLNLKVFLEGYYIGAGQMTPVMLNQGYTGSPAATAAEVDDLTVQLRDAANPVNVIASASSRMHTDGTVQLTYPALTGNYYIVMLHRNAIQTWSKYPVAFYPGTVSYDFTIAASQAYGDNQKQMQAGTWALYSGDISPDENLDLLDLALLQNDVNSFIFGYYASDLNGDGNVDLLDISILEENINAFIYSWHP